MVGGIEYSVVLTMTILLVQIPHVFEEGKVVMTGTTLPVLEPLTLVEE